MGQVERNVIGVFAAIFIAAIVFAFLRITSVSYTGLATKITASVSFIKLVREYSETMELKP